MVGTSSVKESPETDPPFTGIAGRIGAMAGKPLEKKRADFRGY